MFLNVCKQTFYISHARISQNVKGLLRQGLLNFRHVWKSDIADFQIWISIPSNSSFIELVLQNNQLNGILYYCPIVTRKTFVQLIGNRQKKFTIASLQQKSYTAQKMKFFVKDFFSKCDQICSFLQIWSHLLIKSLMEKFVFCAVLTWRIRQKKVHFFREDFDFLKSI